MKKFTLWTAAAVAVGLLVVNVAPAQNPAGGATAAATPHQIGLIDMAHIFKNYEKFKHQTEALQKAAEDAEEKAQNLIKQMQGIQEQAQNLTPGSPDFDKLEAQMIELQTQLQALKQKEQREIVRKQADLYKQIYLEVQDAVAQYAKYYKYTLIIRFNRQDVADTANPQEIIQSMNRQVVWYQTEDDVTEPILKYLNEKYKRSASAR